MNLFVEVRCCVSLDKPGQKGLGFAVLATELGFLIWELVVKGHWLSLRIVSSSISHMKGCNYINPDYIY